MKVSMLLCVLEESHTPSMSGIVTMSKMVSLVCTERRHGMTSTQVVQMGHVYLFLDL